MLSSARCFSPAVNFSIRDGPADVYLGMLGDVMKLFPEDAEVLSHPSHRRCLLLPRGCFRTGIASKEIIIGDTDVHHVGVGHPLHDAGVEHLVEEVARTVARPPQYLHPASQESTDSPRTQSKRCPLTLQVTVL